MEINGWVIYDDANIPMWNTFTVYAPVLGDERDWRRITKIKCACGEECNTEVTDGFVFPKTYTFLMDRNDGWITLYMNSLFATKFILVYDGVEIYNSGYIGDNTYQSDLDNYLTNIGLPTEPIINTSFETFSFYKNSTVNEIGLYVYSPLGEFEASVSCPENPVTTTSTTQTSTSTSTSSTTSSTSTQPQTTSTTTTIQ